MNSFSAITRPRHRNAGRPPEKSARGFLQYVRGRECLFVNRGGCEGRIEAMHLDFAGGKGVGTKVADSYSVPACQGHHRRQHQKGWVSFLREVARSKDDLLAAAALLWARWPGRRGWEVKQVVKS